jgi:hypothetical protein
LGKIRDRLVPLTGERLSNGFPRHLFRGQSKDWGALKPGVARLPWDDAVQAHMAYRMAEKIASGLMGYRTPKLDGYAVLQHYGWPTPLLDFSGTLEVAVFMALFDAQPGQHCVIYHLDLSVVPKGLLVFSEREPELMRSGQIQNPERKVLILDHTFLTHPLGEGGLKHRWLRQDGFALTAARFDFLEVALEFDLLAHPVGEFIKRYAFLPRDEDQALIGNLYDLHDDPLPAQLQYSLPFHVIPWVRELRPKLGQALRNFSIPPEPTRTFIHKTDRVQKMP